MNKKIKISGAIEGFMQTRTRRDTTSRLYRYALSLFERHLNAKCDIIGEVIDADISSFCRYLENTYAPNSACIIYGIVKSLFLFCERHGFIDINPCSLIDEKRYFCKHKHHQALTRMQFDACEKSFWENYNNHIAKRRESVALLVSSSCYIKVFSQLCFIMGFYLQGLSFADLLMLKMASIKEGVLEKRHCFIIVTSRRKTGKEVKIVIPKEHVKRHHLFKVLFEDAKKQKRQYLFPICSELADDTYIYNKVKKLNGTVNRNLKIWWRQLNNSVLRECPIDIASTSYYSCRHTFATLYIDSPNASLGELASLMGRNTEYIDTYIREITSENKLLHASSKVFGVAEEDGASQLQQMLDNQKTIISMLERICGAVEKLCGVNDVNYK